MVLYPSYQLIQSAVLKKQTWIAKSMGINGFPQAQNVWSSH